MGRKHNAERTIAANISNVLVVTAMSQLCIYAKVVNCTRLQATCKYHD